MRNPILRALFGLLAFSLAAACSKTEPPKAEQVPASGEPVSGAAAPDAMARVKIAVVTHGQASDTFWSVVKNGVDTAAKDLRVTVTYNAPQTFDMVAMSRLIDAEVAKKPDGLVVSIPDPSALSRSIKAAVDAGIPVISINSGSDVYKQLGVLMHIGQTEYEAGAGGGERMGASGVKSALCVNHEVGNASLDLRCKGFLDALGKAGGAGKVKLGTFDLTPDVLAGIRDGDILFAIDQQQYLQGYLPVVLLSQRKQYGVLPAIGVLPTGPGFVTKDTADQVIKLSQQGFR